MKKNDLTIIKIGSNALIDSQKKIRRELIDEILSLVSGRIKNGEKIIIVTSGAVALGRAVLGDSAKHYPKSVVAGVGQVNLIATYFEIARAKGLLISDLLISRPHLVHREQFLKLQDTVNELLEQNVIPIVNENDSLVSGTDWAFGDNDSLATALAIALCAKRLVILSNIDGLYDSDPSKNPQANLIPIVDDVGAEVMRFCSRATSELGSGGMISKLKAARLCAAVGIPTTIVNGLKKSQVELSLSGKKAGTIFTARSDSDQIKNRDRWILSAKSSAGSIVIDDGAVVALCHGKSLLAVGIKKIIGNFAVKEIVELVNARNEGVAFGICDLDSIALQKTLNSEKTGVQVMHADNIMTYHGVCSILKKSR